MNASFELLEQVDMLEPDPDLLVSMYSDNFYTMIRKSLAGCSESLVLEQDNGAKSEERDIILLDRNAQHALYLILKNRFEK